MALESKHQSKLQLFELQIMRISKDRIYYLKNGKFNTTFYVKAIHRQSKKWLKAKVLDTRLAKDLDYLASDEKTHESYEYYVQFDGLDKRNDYWARWSQIQTTFEKIEDKQDENLESKNIHPNDDPHFGFSPLQRSYHKKITKIKTIQKIKLGGLTADTWYYSPYPPPYQNLQILYICQYCFSFYAKQSEFNYHDANCPLAHPPGNQIYRDLEHNISVFEIDGEKNPVYCQNLAFFSKLYLNHKNLSEDMTIFIFYVLCQFKNGQFNFAGYFSKAKLSHNNLSCILVSPFHQRKGYGKFLISLSYQLSLVDGLIGSPEKPFSDLGRQTYLSYWKKKIITVLLDNPHQKKQLPELRIMTGFATEDILWCLEKCNLIERKADQNKYIGNLKQLMTIYKETPDIPIDIKPNNLHYVPYIQLTKAETKKSRKRQKQQRGKLITEEEAQPMLEKRVKGQQQLDQIE